MGCDAWSPGESLLLALGASVLCALLWARLRGVPIAELLAGRAGGPKTRARLDPRERAALREARKLVGAGRVNAAADLLVGVGTREAKEEAARLLLQARLLARGGELLEQLGDLDEALQAYETGGELGASARVLEKLGELRRAGAVYEQAQRWGEAARCWGAVGQHGRAGGAWRLAGEFEKAGDAYAAGDDPLEAALAYGRAQAALEARPVFDRGEAVVTTGDIARKRGECWLAAGDPLQAADVFALVGLDQEAARAYELAGNLVGAAAARARSSDWQGAAALLERAGKAAEATGYIARAELEAGDERAAAELFEQAGDFERAAMLRTRTGEHDRAAELFERGAAWGAAALAWQEAAAPAKAARAWELAGRADQAAERYQDAGLVTSELRLRELGGEWLRVGELRLHKGNLDGAEEALRKVAIADPAYRRACRILGEVYEARQEWGAAAVKYQLSVDGLKPAAETARWWYHGGDCALRAGEWTIATALLSELRGFDPTFRDVRETRQQRSRRPVELWGGRVHGPMIPRPANGSQGVLDPARALHPLRPLPADAHSGDAAVRGQHAQDEGGEEARHGPAA